jgi:hypothetical protein
MTDNIHTLSPELVEQFNRRRAKANGAARPLTLIPFDQIGVSADPEYIIEGLIPAEGLTIIWGPPKSFKSFWAQDMAMHIALGWDYRDHKVRQGSVVYCAFEGGKGFEKRCVAYRQKHLAAYEDAVPFYLQKIRMDLIVEVERLVETIKADAIAPSLVVLDTLNRSLVGSENKDEDMGAYIAAADRLREEFHCAVIIVHHCGLEGTRPRGHSSLTGAGDAQLAVKRTGKTSTLTVEFMKDGEEGLALCSQLEVVEIGQRPDGMPITSCALVPASEAQVQSAKHETRMTPNQKTMYRLLYTAGRLKTDDWNELARKEGIGVKRRADLIDIRMALIDKKLVKLVGGDEWGINHSDHVTV